MLVSVSSMILGLVILYLQSNNYDCVFLTFKCIFVYMYLQELVETLSMVQILWTVWKYFSTIRRQRVRSFILRENEIKLVTIIS